jgi:hypothetical protein
VEQVRIVAATFLAVQVQLERRAAGVDPSPLRCGDWRAALENLAQRLP